MKNIMISTLLASSASLLFSSCSNEEPQPNNQKVYNSELVDSSLKNESLHFERQGGGQIEFDVYPESDDTLRLIVNELNFQDTIIEKYIVKNSSNNEIFTAYFNVIGTTKDVTGDFKQPEGLTGTWSYIYTSQNERLVEVTNIDMRNSLADIEAFVQNEIE